MKTILSTTAAFLLTGAVGGYFYEATKLRQPHQYALTDFTFEMIYALTFSILGCVAGLLIGIVIHWLTGSLNPQSADH